MPNLADATAVYAGGQPAIAAYYGSEKVWPTTVTGPVPELPGRPVDWLSYPFAIGTARIGLLVHVPDGGTATAIVAYTGNPVSINWGDGTTDTLKTHTYSAASLPPGSLTSDGKRQVWATFDNSPIGLSVTDSATVELYAGATANLFHEWTVESALRFAFVGYLQSDGLGLAGYQVLEYASVGGMSPGAGFGLFSDDGALRGCDVVTTGVTTCRIMFAGCRALQSIPALDTSSCSIFASMFSQCHSLTAIPPMNTSLGLAFQYMFEQCYLITTVPMMDTSSGADFASMFTLCRALTSVPALDLSSGIDFWSMFNGCTALASIAATGARYDISIFGTAMGAVAIDAFFLGLGTAAGAQDVNVDSTPGEETCTRDFATAKGWTVLPELPLVEAGTFGAFDWFHDNPSGVPDFTPPWDVPATCSFNRSTNTLTINSPAFQASLLGAAWSVYWPDYEANMAHPDPRNPTGYSLRADCWWDVTEPLKGFLHTSWAYWSPNGSSTTTDEWGSWEMRGSYPREGEPNGITPAPPGYWCVFIMCLTPAADIPAGTIQITGPAVTWLQEP